MSGWRPSWAVIGEAKPWIDVVTPFLSPVQQKRASLLKAPLWQWVCPVDARLREPGTACPGCETRQGVAA